MIFLLNRRCIGGKHTEERKLIRSKARWVNQAERKAFEKQYKEALNKDLILRCKKRTGKGSDWHISLNPRKLDELYKMLEDD